MNEHIEKNKTTGTQPPQGIVDHIGDDMKRRIIPYVKSSECVLQMFPCEALYCLVIYDIESVIPVQKKIVAECVGIYRKGKAGQNNYGEEVRSYFLKNGLSHSC